MGVDRSRFDEVIRHGLVFVLRLALVLGGLGFASVFAVALLVGGIYLIATGHPTGGYALAGASALTGIGAMALVLAAIVRVNKGERWN